MNQYNFLRSHSLLSRDLLSALGDNAQLNDGVAYLVVRCDRPRDILLHICDFAPAVDALDLLGVMVMGTESPIAAVDIETMAAVWEERNPAA